MNNVPEIMRDIHIHYYLLHFHIYTFIIIFYFISFYYFILLIYWTKLSLGDISLFQNEFDDWNNTGAVLCNCFRFFSGICDVVILITR